MPGVRSKRGPVHCALQIIQRKRPRCFGHGRRRTFAGNLRASFGQLLVVLRSGRVSWGKFVRPAISASVTAVTGAPSIFWTRVFEWHGYEPTHEAAIAFAKSWRRET